MAVGTFNPKVEVRLIKLVTRSDGVAARFSGADREVDLTPFLGERSIVRTTKSVREPAGSFTISIPDQPDPKTGDTLYALVEPMDMIEVRGARKPHFYSGQRLPLIMRGFVSSVTRSEAMPGGRPERVVVIEGQDAGKLWLINQVFWSVAVALGEPMLDTFGMLAAVGIDPRPQEVAAFMDQLAKKVMNPKVAALAAYANKAVPGFAVDALVPDGVCAVQIAAQTQGPLWNYVELFADRPWNEAYIDQLTPDRDANEGPVLVHRPAPFRDLTGAYIIPGATDPGTMALDISQVVSLSVSRSDSRTANFFWVPPGDGMLDSQQSVTASVLANATGTLLDLDHPNCAQQLYGIRQMTAQSRLMPSNLGTLTAMLAPGEQPASGSDITQWYVLRANQLRRMNEDNAALEEGSMVVQGSETLRAGKYVSLTRGAITSMAYVPAVSHTIPAMGPWTTTLAMERGTGFLERAKVQGKPFFLEGRQGALP